MNRTTSTKIESTKQVTKSRRVNGVGAPFGNKNALKHGLHHYKAMLNGDGIDQRSGLFRALRAKEQELVAALGGDPSPQEQAIIADSVKNMLYVASLDNYLMSLKSLVRKGRAHSVLAIRTQLSAHLRENLKTLGLKRVTKNLTINDLLIDEPQEPDNDDGK